MMYLKKTKILAGLLLSINGFLHASDSIPALQDQIKLRKVQDQMVDACKRALEETGLTYLSEKDSEKPNANPLLNSAHAIGLTRESLKNGGTITDRLLRLEGSQSTFSTHIVNIIRTLVNAIYESRTNMNMLIEELNGLKESIALLQASQDAHDSVTRSILDPNIMQEDPIDVVKRERAKFLPDPVPVTPLPYTEEQLKKKHAPETPLDSLMQTIEDSFISKTLPTESNDDE